MNASREDTHALLHPTRDVWWLNTTNNRKLLDRSPNGISLRK